MVTATRWLAGALALVCGEAGAAERALPGGLDLTAGAEVGVLYDDNALLGRRGQFLDAPTTEGGRRVDIAATQTVDLDVGRRFGRGDRASASGRFRLAELRQTEELQGYDAVAGLALRKSLGPTSAVTPEVRFSYHRDQPEWTYRLLEPGLRAGTTFSWGTMAELRYRYSDQTFARYGGGEPAPRNSYANVDSRAHLAALDLRQWIARRVRANLVGEFAAADYDGSVSPTLADYAGIELGDARRDLGAAAKASVLVVALEWLLVEPGARYDWNDSSAGAYSFRAVRGLLDVMVAPWRGHALLGTLDYGRYDFPDQQFDRRFDDTRRDFRRQIRAIYQLRFEPVADLRLELVYAREDNVSNDCAAFDPQRDEAGLPVYSRSYSCYARDRVEASARWEF